MSGSESILLDSRGMLLKCIPDDSALMAWVDDLKRLHGTTFDSVAWGIVGHAVAIQHDDEAEVRAFLADVVAEVGFTLKVVEREDVLKCEAVETLIDSEPALLYLAPGTWLGEDFDAESIANDGEAGKDEVAGEKFRNLLAQALRSSMTSRRVVVVTTIESGEQLARRLRQQGCFDRRICWPKVDEEALGELFVTETGRSFFEREICLRRVGAVIKNEAGERRRRQLLGQALRRRAWRSKQPIGLGDIVELAIWGTVEEDLPPNPPGERRVHAIHEAGHALVCWFTSRAQIAPFYTSVRSGGKYLGVLIPPYEGHEQTTDDMSFRDAVHHIDVLLGGRAAEYLVLGEELISVGGATSDLRRAARLGREMFGDWGLSVSAETPSAFAANLAPIDKDSSPQDVTRVEGLVRQFLQQRFLAVLELLSRHRFMLMAIADAIATKGVLFQSDFEELGSANGVQLRAVAMERREQDGCYGLGDRSPAVA